MKTTIFFLLLSVSSHLFSQWGPDVRLTIDGANSYASLNNARNIAVAGNTVHVIWADDRISSSNAEIYYKRSTDAGLSWSSDIRLTNASGWSTHPSITVSGSNVHVAWIDERDGGNFEIYYKRSTDSGLNWGSDVRLTSATGMSDVPSIAVSGSIVHVVWQDNRDGNYEVYYKRSTNGGLNWSTDLRMTSNSGNSFNPSVAASGSYAYMVWQDNSVDNNFEIYAYYSTNDGASWSSFIRLTNNSASSEYPCVSASGSNVHVVWHDNRDGNFEIYYKRSTNNAVNWGSDVRMTINSGISQYPSIVALGNYAGMVWQDNSVDNNYEIYHYFSSNNGATWSSFQRLTNNTAVSRYPHIAAFGSGVHVVWNDDRDGNWEIYYKRNPTGVVSVQPVGSLIPQDYRLSQNYPNPFNPVTMIEFDIPKLSYITIRIYDILGREVSRPVEQRLEAGRYTVDFDASELSSGTYFYRIEASDASSGSAQLFRDVKKMIILK